MCQAKGSGDEIAGASEARLEVECQFFGVLDGFVEFLLGSVGASLEGGFNDDGLDVGKADEAEGEFEVAFLEVEGLGVGAGGVGAAAGEEEAEGFAGDEAGVAGVRGEGEGVGGLDEDVEVVF